MSLAFSYRDELHVRHKERRQRWSSPQLRLAFPKCAGTVIRFPRTSIGPDANDHVLTWRLVQARPPLPLRHVIARDHCRAHGVTFAEVSGLSRAAPMVRIRQALFYRLAAETPMSLPEIGRFVGGRDHTTVIHGIRRHAALNDLPHPRAPNMTEDHAIVPQQHALLRPGQPLTDVLIDDAHMAALRGEITPAEFRAVHGEEAGDWLAREMGEVGRG